jgi:hypothetical protein
LNSKKNKIKFSKLKNCLKIVKKIRKMLKKSKKMEKIKKKNQEKSGKIIEK